MLQDLTRRLARLERLLSDDRDGSFTLEELCRAMWRTDKPHFIQLAKEHLMFSRFIAEFERADAERNEIVVMH